MCRPVASIPGRELDGLARGQARDVDVGRPGVPPGVAGGARPAGDLDALEAVGRGPVGHLRQRRLRERCGQQAEPHRTVTSVAAPVRDVARWRCCDRLDPAARAGAPRDGVADEHLVVAVRERRRTAGERTAASHDVRVDRPGKGAERVEEALDMAARQGGCRPAGRAHQGRVADEDLVGPVAVADPELVGLLAVPGERRRRAVDLVLQRVLPAGADLRDADRAAGAAVEPQQDRGGVLGRDRPLHRVGRALGRERLDRAGGLPAGRR